MQHEVLLCWSPIAIHKRTAPDPEPATQHFMLRRIRDNAWHYAEKNEWLTPRPHNYRPRTLVEQVKPDRAP